MLHLRRDFKDLQRLRQIIAVLTEEGLGYYISKLKLHKHLPFHKRLTPTTPITDLQQQAVALRKSFEKLGATFVKLGQLLSIRPDLVPPEYAQEFEKLQDSLPSFPYSQVKTTIETELKKPIEKIYKTFDKKPFACASIAQVHRATLHNGKKVVVKIQRPKIKETIDADLDILFHAAHLLEKHSRAIKNYRPVEIVKEFALWTRKEINFENEIRNANQLRNELKNNKNVLVPKVYANLSSKKVLTLDFVNGVKIDNLSAIKKFKINRSKLAMTYFLSILEQALLYGFFHADPHPANIFVTKQGKLAYLDYGIMGELGIDDRKKVIRFVESIPDKNPEESLDIILTLATRYDKETVQYFRSEAIPILIDVYSHSISDKSIGRGMYEIIGLGAKYGVIFTASHVLIAKAIYQAEGMALKLDPKFRVSDGLRKFMDEFLAKEFNPLQLAKEAKRELMSHKDLVLDLPKHIAAIVKNLETSKQEHCEGQHLYKLEARWEYVNRRRNLVYLTAALFVSAAILFSSGGRHLVFGLSLELLLLIVGFVLLIHFFYSRKTPFITEEQQ